MKNLKGFKAEEQNSINPPEQAYLMAKQKYAHLSEDALLNELRSQIEKSKADGTYSQQRILDYASAITPYLTTEQKEKLDKIIKLINQ